MKRPLPRTSLLQLGLALAAYALPVAEAAADDVASAAEFADAAAAGRDIHLTADLDFSGAEWTPCDYAGTLDGDGHSIAGLSKPLFATLTGKAANLTITGSTNVSDAAAISIGFIARTMTGESAISNCTVDATCSVSLITAGNQNNHNAGGLVGSLVSSSAKGAWIYDSTNAASIAVGAEHYNLYYGVGGIVGIVSGTLSASTCGVVRCANRGAITLGDQRTCCGGIAGRIQMNGCGTYMQIVDCANFGDVVADKPTKYKSDYAGRSLGGIVGSIGERHLKGRFYFERCVNRGKIDAKTAGAEDDTLHHVFAGGIVGSTEAFGASWSYLYFDDCADYGDIAGEYAGGLYGFIGETTETEQSNINKREEGTRVIFRNCASYGAISATTLGGACFGFCATTKATPTNVERKLYNSFFLVPASGQLATIGGGIAFTTSGVIRSDDAGYEPKTAAKALAESAGEGHGPWGVGRLANSAKSVVPELLAFRTKPWKPTFAVVIR